MKNFYFSLLFTINVFRYNSYSHYIPYLHNLETKQDIADYFDLTLAASTDPATPYTIHNKSGLDDDGQTCAK